MKQHEIEELDLFRDWMPGHTERIIDTEVHADDSVGLQRGPELDEAPSDNTVVVEEDDPLSQVAVEEVAEGQLAFIERTEAWEVEWQSMPAYAREEQKPWRTIRVHFECQADMDKFMTTVGQQFTHKALDWMGVPHYIVVEAQEYDNYAAVVAPTATLLVLDENYKRDYDTCDDLGDTKGKGPGPARNFCWDHAISIGAEWHWVMDDNIRKFYRRWNNLRVPSRTPTFFRCMEDFTLRYENVGMAGPYYKMFAPDEAALPPFYTNTRVYSCNLIRNDLPFRWRGRYNEDTDLSLCMLKAGWCTIQFIAFLQDKIATQHMVGGNTDMFYKNEGTLAKSQMQVKLHPDVSKLVYRYDRWHHHVDYSQFRKIKLRRKPDVVIPEAPDEYGMVLQVDEQVTGPDVNVEADDERP
jgi:hypothetical protein